MFGIFLFWLCYIVSAICLYTILRGCYKMERTSNYKYVKTKERYKRPLWQILLFVTIFFIPIGNIAFFIVYLCISSDAKKNELYYESFMTKEY